MSAGDVDGSMLIVVVASDGDYWLGRQDPWTDSTVDHVRPSMPLPGGVAGAIGDVPQRLELVVRVAVTTAGTVAFGTIPSYWACFAGAFLLTCYQQHHQVAVALRPAIDPWRTERRPRQRLQRRRD